ncbi:MAG: hypothetical protein IT371_17605 [Deltaproteobacteria bacterium]|nr:hypothetical protein [Deltaproteobacteria bacterium]
MSRARVFALVGLAAAGVAVGACRRGATGPDATGRAGGERSSLVVQLEDEPAHLTSLIQPDAWAHRLSMGLLLQGLVRVDPASNRVVGDLATRWEVSPDGLVYTFHLRQGVRWHDGRPFTAKDVVFTFERVLDERVRAVSMRAALAPFVLRYEAVGPLQFKLRLKESSFFFLQELTSLPILPEHLMRQGDLNQHSLLRRPVGTGPYRFASWVPGQQVVYERFDGYWGPRALIPRLVFRIVRQPEVALKLARRGELDFLPRVRPGQWAEATGSDASLIRRFAPVRHFSPGTSFIVVNHRRSLFADRRVRRALAQLLDLPLIERQIMRGLARRSLSLFWSGDPLYLAGSKPVAFDPPQARKLLAEAGFADRDGDGILERAGVPFRFTFLVVASSATMRRWLTIYQAELARAGIRMELVPIDWAVFLKRLRAHDFDAGALGMAQVGPHTDLYLQLHSSQIQDGQNYAAYQDPRSDRLLELLRTERDPGRRKQHANALQALLAEELPLIPLFTLEEPGLVARRVKGVRSYDVWYQLAEWAIPAG